MIDLSATPKFVVLGVMLLLIGLFGGVRAKNFNYASADAYEVVTKEDIEKLFIESGAESKEINPIIGKLDEQLENYKIIRFVNDYQVRCDSTVHIRKEGGSIIFLVYKGPLSLDSPLVYAVQGKGGILGYAFLLKNGNVVVGRSLESNDIGSQCGFTCKAFEVNEPHCGESVDYQVAIVKGTVEHAGFIDMLFKGNVRATYINIAIGLILIFFAGKIDSLIPRKKKSTP